MVFRPFGNSWRANRGGHFCYFNYELDVRSKADISARAINVPFRGKSGHWPSSSRLVQVGTMAGHEPRGINEAARVHHVSWRRGG
jgi:hypothetical protein